ncbi:DUF1533 domain-containing protein [Paenibacillus sp. HWE-109]|uniref:hemoblobin-interacting domain-containing protein n=1 Tax=Paenibacillus sp. HWE-109 TaxID=1306526 RepID=UPI001EDCCD0B|nr:hemoblobin-interacting domain-containing protein [Paenibacillus sp. HWE-109]UKS25921.1 DUF1533 domain-containing protein [Paenibacillus sp. HWE-109]
MFKKNEGFKKTISGRIVAFLLALTIAIVPFSASFSTTAHAIQAVTTPITLQSTVVSNQNRDVTLTFNKPVELLSGYLSLIDIKRTNEGAFTSLVNSNQAYVRISNTGALVLCFSNPLVGDNNLIRIKAGAVAEQDNSNTLAIDQVTSPIIANDLSAPEIESKSISNDFKVVTLTFNTTVQTATYVENTQTYPVDLHKFVNIQPIYDDSEFIPLSANDQISISGNQMVITFASARSGYQAIQVQSGAIKGVNGNVNEELYADLNLNALAYTYNRLYDNSDLTLYFNQDFGTTLSEDALKAAVTISKDNGAFQALGANDKVAVGSNEPVFRSQDRGLGIHFFPALTPGTYTIKIAANALKTSIGIPSGEILTVDDERSSIVVSDITAPNFQKAEVSADGKIITLTYDKKLYDNSMNSCVWYRACNSLANFVFIERSDNGEFENLDGQDSVQLSDKQLMVTLHTALNGAKNKIAIDPNVLKDVHGNIQRSGLVTQFLTASVVSAQYLNSTIDNGNKDWTLFFDKNITSNLTSLEDLQSAVKLSIGGVEKSIDASTTITFIDKKMVIHFSTPLVDRNTKVHISANTLKDSAQHVLAESILTEALVPNDFYPPTFSSANLITSHTAALYFNIQNSSNYSSLVDNTKDAAGSHLKEAVMYSTDNGATFSALQAKDSVAINGRYVHVYFYNLIQGKLQIKIAANALKDTSGNILTTTVLSGNIRTDLYAPYLLGSFFSDAPSVLTFEDNESWRSKIEKVVVKERTYIWPYDWNERTLSSAEYTVGKGKVTINQGVFEEDLYYKVEIYANGFNSSSTNDIRAVQSKDSYYITPVTIDTEDGITAKVKIASNRSYGHLNVIFQLMNGQTPVSIVAAESEQFARGTFTANFNMADAKTNSAYTVKAFVVSEYSNSPLSVGVNLATQITEAEYDYIQNID